MTAAENFQKRYESGDTPWDIGRPDFNLIQTVSAMALAPCKALDIGCGTGDDSIWLSQKDFYVIGIDNSEIAIEKAREKAAKAKVQCTFMVIDFLTSKIAGAPFGFAFDRGCFHTLNSDEERKSFAENVAAHLIKDGLWLSLVGSADEQCQGPGPPQRTARDIVDSVESHFEILSLVSSYFESKRPNPPKAWVCLMRKRLLA
ncbi:MAG: methyltransferase domain-containing protein [Desulfobaccales bacterium]